jgi:methanogenic corrinoid protein MtbC1
MTEDVVHTYLDRLLAGDLHGARRHIEELLAKRSPRQVILEVLAPAQAEIGRRWEMNECSVADEHVATSITDAVLAQVGAAMPPSTSATTVAVACAEGDWHTVPARMGAELLHAEGFRVRFLGGSLPADHLEGYLVKLKPTALCLSCSLPLFLSGALRSIEASHRAGIPVMAGGRGFGRDDHAALRVGADAWARNMIVASRRLQTWAHGPLRRLATPVADTMAWSAIELGRAEVVDNSMALLFETQPWIRALNDKQLSHTREDLAYILQFLAVALLVDDDRVFVEFLAWLGDVLTSRKVPLATLEATLPVLAKSLAAADLLTPRIERLLRAAGHVDGTTQAASET